MKKLFSILAFMFVAATSFGQAKIAGDGSIEPTGNFPALKDQHLKGSMRVVADTTSRNAIPSLFRKDGMLVQTLSPFQLWQLDSSASPIWKPFSSGTTTTSLPWDSITGKPTNFSTTYALSNDIRDSIQARVTLGTPQAITGVKTMTSPIIIGSLTLDGGASINTSNQFYLLTSNYTDGIVVGYDSFATYLGYKMGALPLHIGTLGTGKAFFKNSGGVVIENLAGTGSRMVVADSTGQLTTQTIPSSPVTSVFGRTGAVAAQSGDYTTAQVTESGNLYYTDARARAAISLTTTGTGGAATYSGGVLNIPQYQTQLGYTAENTANKGVANGYADLDANGKVPASRIDFGQTGQTYVVASQSEMLAITGANVGALAIRTDQNRNYRLIAQPASTLANWIMLLSPDAPVQSVNGQTGNVNLLTTNISEGSNLYFTNARAITALTGQNISIFNNNSGYITSSVSATSSSTYGLNVTGSSGGARAIFIAGQLGYSNGFTVDYNGTNMVYTMRNGNLSVSDGSVTSTGLIINGTETYFAPANYASGGFSRILGRNAATGRIEGMSNSDIQSFLGLGSNAYTSTAFLPLSGGSLTGSGRILGLRKSSAFTGNLYVGYQNEAGTETAFVGYGSGSNNTFSIVNTLDAVLLQPSGGNVAIGNNSPLSLFHVSGSSASAIQAYIHNTNGATNSAAELVFGTWSGAIPTGSGNPGPSAKISAVNTNASNAATDLVFHTYASTGTSAERFRISSTGAATFSGDLTISKTSPALILTRSATTNSSYILFNTSTTQNWYVGTNALGTNLNNLYIYNYGVGGSAMDINYSNNAVTFSSSITSTSFIRSGGTSSQFLKADGSVDGSTYLTSAVTSATGTANQITVSASTGSVTFSLPSAVTISGNMTAAGFFESSDLRQKNVHSTLISKDGINPIQYTFLPDGKQKWGYGAQQVQGILPYAVHEDDKGFLKVDYTTVHTYKIAMLEQRIAELEKLKEHTAHLAARVMDLQAQIIELKTPKK